MIHMGHHMLLLLQLLLLLLLLLLQQFLSVLLSLLLRLFCSPGTPGLMMVVCAGPRALGSAADLAQRRWSWSSLVAALRFPRCMQACCSSQLRRARLVFFT